jgi:lipid-binding SYLF domain-containing protein
MMIAMGLLLVGTFLVNSPASAFDAYDFNKKVAATLVDFDKNISNSEELINNAAGVLVCPRIGKIGLWIGVESGACALQIDGETVSYYKGSSASFGLTVGASSHSQVIGFMTEEQLKKFQAKEKGWTSGVDGQVALATVGAGGKANFKNKPIAMVAWGQKGLIADLSVEGGTYKLIGDAEDYSKYGVPIHRFTVSADVSDPSRRGAATAQMTVEIQAWITDEERTMMREVIAKDGTVAARNALAEMPALGIIKGAGKTTHVQWARAVQKTDGNWRIILASTDPIEQALAAHQTGQMKDNFSLIQLDVDDKNHVGTGVLLMGPELSYDESTGVTVKQRGQMNPIKLTSVSYRELD